MLSKRNVQHVSIPKLIIEFNEVLNGAMNTPVNRPGISDNGLGEYIDRMKVLRNELAARLEIDLRRRPYAKRVELRDRVTNMTFAIGLQGRRTIPHGSENDE